MSNLNTRDNNTDNETNKSLLSEGEASKKQVVKVKKTVYETNYDRLVKLNLLGDGGQISSYLKGRSGGYMDLVIERFPQHYNDSGTKAVAYSLAHYYSQNGDWCKDPE